jgi:hypothetical protein
MKTENLTLLEAAKALLEGKRVEYRSKLEDTWYKWEGLCWSVSWDVRIAPEPKKMRKVKMLAWFNQVGSLTLVEEGRHWIPKDWQRVPAEDKEIEVEDV